MLNLTKHSALARRAFLALAAASALTFLAAPVAVATEKPYKIGFHLWKPGKIYDEAMAGIRDGLQLEGIEYEEVIMESGKDKELARENLLKLDAMGLDVIYSLSSAGTKIAKALSLKTPVVATVINHPASLGVGQGDSNGGTKLTGTSYYVDANKQLALYMSLFPEAREIGMIFDSNNPAGALAEEPFMGQACNDAGLKFHSVGITEKEELVEAAEKLIANGADMIVVPTNRLVYGNLDIVMAVTEEHGVPIVSMNKQGVENGAMAALYADTYNLGRQTAAMVSQILEQGTEVPAIPFQFIPEPDVILNLSSANSLDFEFPAEVLSSAAIVMQ